MERDGTPCGAAQPRTNQCFLLLGTDTSAQYCCPYVLCRRMQTTAQWTYIFSRWSSIRSKEASQPKKGENRMHFDGNKVLHQFWEVQVHRTCCFVTSSSCISLLSVFISATATQQRLTANSARNKLCQEILWFSILAEQLLSFFVSFCSDKSLQQQLDYY